MGIQEDALRAAVQADLVATWAGTDPFAAAAWAREISDPAVRRTHARALLGIWIAIGGKSARMEIRNLDLPELIKREFVEDR